MWIVSIVLLIELFGAPEARQETPLAPVQEVTPEKIQDWVRDLGSPNFDEREIAISNLLELGDPAIPHLEEAVKNSKVPEVRWNAKRLLKDLRRALRPPAPGGEIHPPVPPGGSWNWEQELKHFMEDQRRWRSRFQSEWDDRVRKFFGPDFMDRWRGGPFEKDWLDLRSMDDLEQRLRDLQDKLHWTGRGNTGTSFQFEQRADGSVRAEVRKTEEGKESTEVFEADSMEAFREKYPDVVKQYGLDSGQGRIFQFRFGGGDWDSSLPLQRFPFESGARKALPLEGDRLGVHVERISPTVSEFVGLEPGVGLLVNEVVEKSLAKSLGIRAKDILVSINEEKIYTPKTIAEVLRSLQPGDAVQVEVARRGSEELVLLKGHKPEGGEPKPLERVEKGKDKK